MNKKRHILLVDNDENILRSLTRLLEDEGYHLEACDGGKEGLEKLWQETYGLVITDQRIVGMSGIEFLAKAKEVAPDTIRMVLSGFNDLRTTVDAINEGHIFRFLSKPWDDDQLLKSIDDAFSYYEMNEANKRLTEELKAANIELASNHAMAEEEVKRLRSLPEQIHFLKYSQAVLDHFPFDIILTNEQGCVLDCNDSAKEHFIHDNHEGVPLEKVTPKGFVIKDLVEVNSLLFLNELESISGNGFIRYKIREENSHFNFLIGKM